MGWCSGTDVYDQIFEAIIDKDADLEPDVQYAIMLKVTKALEDNDWDCPGDFEIMIYTKKS